MLSAVVRDINPCDKPALARMHSLLSDDTRYRRFHGAKHHLTHGDLQYLCEVDGHDHVARVADEQGMGELVAVARGVRIGRDEAEVAVVVRDDHQHSGVGRELVGDLLRRLRDEGFERAVAQVQADNHRAIAFFQSLGARQRGLPAGGVLDLVFDLTR